LLCHIRRFEGNAGQGYANEINTRVENAMNDRRAEHRVGNTLGQMQGRTEGRSWVRKATVNYAGRNWRAKFEIRIEGSKERDPAKE